MYTIITMQRTQVYLPKTQQQSLQRLAQRRQTSVAGVLRWIIAQYMLEAQPKPTRKVRPSFLKLAKKLETQGERAPRDLATHLDRYLYGQ